MRRFRFVNLSHTLLSTAIHGAQVLGIGLCGWGILARRPVLLLNEATSALDGATEARLLKNLRAMTDHTVLIVTRREAALDYCDQQIPFEKPGNGNQNGTKA